MAAAIGANGALAVITGTGQQAVTQYIHLMSASVQDSRDSADTTGTCSAPGTVKHCVPETSITGRTRYKAQFKGCFAAADCEGTPPTFEECTTHHCQVDIGKTYLGYWRIDSIRDYFDDVGGAIMYEGEMTSVGVITVTGTL